MWKPRRVLVLGPHTDDYEIGAGGFIHRLLKAGAEVRAMAFSTAKESLRPGLPPDILVHECRESAARLGVARENVRILDIPVRRFPEFRQTILEELVSVKREFAPDLVVAHASTDIHQDHQVVAAEALRAFKQTTVLGCELPWNNVSFSAQCFVELSPENLEAKLHALSAYESQSHRTSADLEVLRALARVRGASAGVRYAEAFEVIRWALPIHLAKGD